MSKKKEAVETTEEKIDSLPPENATLMQRINWVRDRVTRLGKDSQVSTGGSGSYKAISHDKVTASIRPKMVQAGIFSCIECIKATDAETGATTNKGRKIVQHRGKFAITFCNVNDKADGITLIQYAYADDFGDKAPGKATSYAMKYAMLKMFMIETGEEDEERVESDGGRAAVLNDDQTMLLDLWAVAEEAYGSEEAAQTKLDSLSKRRFHVDNYGLIPQLRLNDAIRSIRQDAQRMRDEENE